MMLLDRLKDAWAALRGAQLPAVRNETFAVTDLERMLDIFQIVPAASGMVVNHRTSMRVAAVYACVRLIAGAISTLPLPVYRNTSDVREKDSSHSLNWLLNEQPTPLCSAAMFWDYVIGTKLLRGDGLAMILRNASAEIIELIPLDPNLTLIERKHNRLGYYVQSTTQDGLPEYIGLDQDDVLHFPGFGWDMKKLGSPILRGMSVIGHAANQSVGNALAMDDYSGRFFANGANPSLKITSPVKMDEAQIERLRAMVQEKILGSQNMRKPLVLTEGLNAEAMSVNAVDAQLNEARLYTVADIARAFGIPPHMIGAMEKTSAWGTGIEQLSIAFVQYTLQPHLTQIQQEINRKAFRTSRYFVEFNVSGLLRGDAKSRSEYYRAALGGAQGPGWMSQNQVRRLENMPPMTGMETGADKLYSPTEKPPPGDSNAKAAEAAA